MDYRFTLIHPITGNTHTTRSAELGSKSDTEVRIAAEKSPDWNVTPVDVVVASDGAVVCAFTATEIRSELEKSPEFDGREREYRVFCE